ncbi:hypothetical protein NQ317_000714 [Molorchus minor]|uniref:Ig-like domain-containing protein n=1 Tax=Molorchus minor TaxID=1323400 RepID=A0ABQ9JH81_9CUCU|nr:hypothetical protein NQ317_000714 [Molorchus minor]
MQPESLTEEETDVTDNTQLKKGSRRRQRKPKPEKKVLEEEVKPEFVNLKPVPKTQQVQETEKIETVSLKPVVKQEIEETKETLPEIEDSEKYVPDVADKIEFKEIQKEQEERPSVPWRREVKTKDEKPIEEKPGLKIGKGKIPEEKEEKEEIKLKPIKTDKKPEQDIPKPSKPEKQTEGEDSKRSQKNHEPSLKSSSCKRLLYLKKSAVKTNLNKKQKVPWRRTPKKDEEQAPEVKDWPRGKRKPAPEEDKEVVGLKPISKEKPELPAYKTQVEEISRQKAVVIPGGDYDDTIKIIPVDSDTQEEEDVTKRKRRKPKQKEQPETQEAELTPVQKEQPDDVSQEPEVRAWRRGKPNEEKPAEEVILVEKPELVPTKIEDTTEQLPEVSEISKSETEIKLIKRKKEATKTQKVKDDKVNEDAIHFQKEMDVQISSKKIKTEQRKVVTFDDNQPIPELEIISQKRTTEGVDKVPDEDLTEKVDVHEEATVHKSVVHKTIGERLRKKTIAPKFIQRVEPVVAEGGKSARLICKVEGTPFPEITWYKNEAVFHATERVFMNITENTVTLEFSKVEPQDVAIYSCKATNTAGVATSTANLKKRKSALPHTLLNPLRPQIIEETSKATLRCVVVGQPTPKLRWFKANEEIVPSPTNVLNYDIQTGEATLQILKPTPKDETVYRVKADNKFGQAECRANLVISKSVSVTQPLVMQAPRITKPVQAVIATTDEEIVLEAEFEGIPKPEVTWLRNGQEIKPSNNYEIDVEENKTTLRIKKKVSKKQKGGKYEVKAANQKGEARSSGTVVITEVVPEAQPPKFIESTKPQKANVGEVVILEAVTEAIPPATFQWFLNSTPITSSPDFRIVTEENKSTLLISEVKPEYGGVITCRAENAIGSVTCTAPLKVLEETEWEETKELEYPRFVKRISPVRVMDGEKVTFSCVVTGKPIPKVQWYQNDMPIKEAKDVVVTQDTEGTCTLTILEAFPENAGEYTCKALNKVGEALCKSTLIVEAYEYVPDSEQAHLTGSEEDLLADKTISETEFPSDTEVECAPKIIKKLPQVVSTKGGDVTRFEVKAVGKPKPEGKWLKHGEEIIPSNEFVIENMEDGTSTLTITEVYPDDSGEIVYEAHNPLGVAVTTSQLLIETPEGTKEYRKPEWVTHMEELSAALKGNSSDRCFLPHACSYDLSTDSLEIIPAGKTKHKQEGKIATGATAHLVSESDAEKVSRFRLADSAALPISETLSYTSVHSEPVCKTKTKGDFVNSAMADYLNSHRHSLSSVMELINCTQRFQTDDTHYQSFDVIDRDYDSTAKTTCDDDEAIFKESDLRLTPEPFFMLSPIEEKSEPSTRSSSLRDSNGSEKRKFIYEIMTKYSSSCNAIPSDPIKS